MAPLLKTLKDEDSHVRWRAIWTLGKIGDVKPVEPLLEALHDECWMVRNEAAVLLAKRKPDDITVALAKTLEAESPDTREEAAWVLGQLHNLKAMFALAGRVKAGDRAAWMAAASLGKWHCPVSVSMLTGALESEDSQLRRAAAWALAQTGSDNAADALRAALSDEDKEVRLWAAEGLRRIGRPSALKACNDTAPEVATSCTQTSHRIVR